ncbi:MAG: hypothetical protein V4719_13465 [Planctomycetota bacterium]
MENREVPMESGSSPDTELSDVREAVKELKKQGGVVEQVGGVVVEIALKTNRSAAALPLLSRFPHLRTLRLHNLPIEANDYRRLASLSGLEELYLARCGPMGGVGLKVIGTLTGLKRLDLSFTKESDVESKTIAHLSGLTKLERLSLSSNSASGADFGFLTDLPHLRSLSLYDVKLVGPVMVDVGKCKPLENLSLCETDIEDKDLKTLRDLVKLRHLNLGNAKGITGHAVKALLPFGSLEELWLQATSFDNSGMGELGRLKSLQRLDLRWCPITDVGLECYQPPDSLKHLVVYSSKVTGAGVKRFLTAFPQIDVYSGWNAKELDALAKHPTPVVPESSAPTEISEPADPLRDQRVRQRAVAITAKHKSQGEPLTTKQALAAFKRLMKFKAASGKPNLSTVWDAFKSFCEFAIDCSGEVFQIEDISENNVSFRLTRFWYQPGIGSDELYMAECRGEVKADEGRWDVPFCQVESPEEFLDHVESRVAFWKHMGGAVTSELELYAGKR